MILKIKDFEETANTAQLRLAKLLNNRGVGMANTPDIEAISFCVKRFSNDGSDRVLIVMSDGSPSYAVVGSGNNAIEDARLLVNRLRAGGMHVFGMSVDRTADAAVGKIYGEKHSLCSTDPNAITKFVEHFI